MVIVVIAKPPTSAGTMLSGCPSIAGADLEQLALTERRACELVSRHRAADDCRGTRPQTSGERYVAGDPDAQAQGQVPGLAKDHCRRLCRLCCSVEGHFGPTFAGTFYFKSMVGAG